VRASAKQQPRNIPTALTPGGASIPGQLTPHSTSAQVNVPVGTIPPRASQGHHPYANASGGYDYGRDTGDDPYAQQYGHASPMVSTAAAASPVNNIRTRGDVGVSHGGDYHGQDDDRPKVTIWRILTCRCG
jgi:casein kinase 1